MKPEIAVAFFSALSLGLCLFLSVLCWLRGQHNAPLRWLAALLCVLALRLSKSVMTVAFPEAAFPTAVIGLVAAALIGPLAWRYVLASQRAPANPFFLQNLHFLPAPLLAFGWVSWLEEVPANWFFGVANALTFTYLVVAILWAKKHRHQLNMTAAWRKGFFAGLGMFCCIFLLLMFCQTVGNTYLLVTSLAALVLYGLSFWAIQHLVLAASFVKKKHHPPEEAAAALRELANRVAALFEKEEIYTDATLTVQKLAQHIQVQPYLLSKAVNFHFGKSFPELLGQYRIRHAENMLQSPIGDGLSIEGIAYESGFASVSAFYAAFKKQHGITPADFKRRRAIVGEGMGGLSSRKAVLK